MLVWCLGCLVVEHPCTRCCAARSWAGGTGEPFPHVDGSLMRLGDGIGKGRGRARKLGPRSGGVAELLSFTPNGDVGGGVVPNSSPLLVGRGGAKPGRPRGEPVVLEPLPVSVEVSLDLVEGDVELG